MNKQALLFLPSIWSLPILVSALLCGCQTTPKLPPIDLAQESGWKLQEGQAVWKTERNAAGIAGDLLFASHPDGRSVVQFTKTPLPFVVARIEPGHWQLEFIPQKRLLTGTGQPPARWIWLHLASSLQGKDPLSPLEFRWEGPHGWVLENVKSGASVRGFLSP